jgi:site-specific recombinase XerC
MRRKGIILDEIIRTDNEAKLPQRAKGNARDPELRIIGALEAGTSPNLPPVSEIGFTAALDAMAENSKLALAADLDCFVDWCASEKRSAFPTDPETLVRYLIVREKKGAKPTTLARRIASIARAHAMLGIEERPASAPMVRDRLKAARRKRGANQRQAAPLRFGSELDRETPKGLTLSAMLSACGRDLPGLRDGALLSLGYDAGLRVSELVEINVRDIEPHEDGSGTLSIAYSKTDQQGKGAWAWLSPDSMRRLGAWLEASEIEQGPVFRRISVTRRKARSAIAPIAYNAIPGNTRYVREKIAGSPARSALTVYTVGTTPLTRQGVNGIYRKVAMEAFDSGNVDVSAAQIYALVCAISTHSLRVGLTQDLFAAGEDGAGIAQALRWQSPATALRYGRKLAVRSNVAAKVLGKLRQ